MVSGLAYNRSATSPLAMRQLASSLTPYLYPGDVVLLTGDLGAGKTQFVQGIAEGLHIDEQVMSPTFNILLTYPDGDIPLYHFDLYRLDAVEELEDIGFYETIESDGVSFVEWGDKFPGIVVNGYLRINIAVEDSGSRRVSALAFGLRARNLLTVWANDSKSCLMKGTGGIL